MGTSKGILLIEDDKELRELLESRLSREGFTVQSCGNGKEGFTLACDSLPSLILLDLMLPDMRGMDICRELKNRSETKHIAIIMVTANADEVDVVSGLEIGADDYITKPFSLRELIARINAVLRRFSPDANSSPVSNRIFGSLHIDMVGREVRVDNRIINLTHAEFELLDYLTSKAGRVVTRPELLKCIAKGEDTLVERNVDVHVGSLRKKLGTGGNCIMTVRSLGYKYVRSEQAE